MKKKPFFWSVFPSLLAVTLLASLSVFLFSVSEYEDSYSGSIKLKLKEQAFLLGRALAADDTLSISKISSISGHLSADSYTRYTVIKADGTVISDSENPAEEMENHSDRPEIIAALGGRTGNSVRFSATLKQDLMYVAVPVSVAGEKIVVRAAYPLLRFSDTISAFSRKIAFLALVVLLVLLGVSFYISDRLSRPLKELQGTAASYAAGDFSVKSGMYPHHETQELAKSMYVMASELEEKIGTLTARTNEQEAILESMVEGVVALDMTGIIILMNGAAGKFLSVDPGNVRGRLFNQAVRNSSFQNFAEELSSSEHSIERTIPAVNISGYESVFRLHGSTIGPEEGEKSGIVFVMHDITQLMRAESIRKEFVANVSHELRTPLTAIRGFIETLNDGAGDNKEDRERFLKIIANHTDRLNSIIEDLLTLSKLEKDEEKPEEIELAPADPVTILNNVKNIFAHSAGKKNITVAVSSTCSGRIMCVSHLIEQALMNLTDNAVKYSPEDTSVTVKCSKSGNDVLFSVTDQGPGIEKIHIPRLFERFYRVDKARSRKEGGTGLGLAIVKHIVNLHKGQVKVESKPGKGSTFTIVIPADGPSEN